MPNSSHISTPLKGMVHDLHLYNTDQTTYSFALNSIVDDFWHSNNSFIGNEQSNICSIEFPIGYQVVGYVEIVEQKRTIYFLHNPNTGMSQIGEVFDCDYTDRTDKIEQVYCKNCPEYKATENTPLEKQQEQCYCNYRIILSSPCLNFSINHRVDIEYKLTNCSLNLYFTDNINERRFIYFDYRDNDFTKELLLQDRFKVEDGTEEPPCETPIYLDELDCEKIKVHPNYSRLCPEFLNFVNGGNLKAGSYQILVAYSDSYGNPMSVYFPATQIIPLFENEITFETNYQTNKALHFRVNNLNPNSVYKYYNVVIAQTVDSLTEFIQVATLPVTQTEYIYTGYEKTLKRLDATEVLFERPFYQYAKGVTKANNYLFYVGVKEYPILNLQRVANNINIGWQTVALKEKDYRDPKNSFFYRTYQRDEIYSVGIIFEYNNGRETCAFHVPGRAPNSNDLEFISPNDDFIEEEYCDTINSCNRSTNPEQKRRWEVYNTGSVIGTPHEYSENCTQDNCWEYGEFAYWESTERYPNVPEIWGDLCGQCIRHHKFPDSCITHIHDSQNGDKGFNDNNYIFPIGIRIDHQSVIDALDQAVIDNIITQEQRDSITGYRIVRGNRVGQKSVIAKGLIYNMFQDNSKVVDTGETYYYPNYPYNDLKTVGIGDTVLDGVSRAPNTMFTFHSPDIHFVNASIGSILKVETEEYGKSEGYFTHSECQAKQKFLSSFAYILSFGLGLAAALSATGEKSCKTITQMSDYKTLPFTTTTSGNTPVGIVAGSSPGAIGTTIVNSPFNANTDVPEVTETHNNDAYTTYDPVLGTPDPPINAAEETITTCTGEAFQIFNNPLLTPWFGGLNVFIQRTILGIAEQNKIMETIRSLIPYTNLSAQYNSVGKYNNYTCTAEGNKVREIVKSAYLTPHILNIDEPSNTPDGTFDTIKLNNWNRESSVYLKLNNSLLDPINIDTSRTSMRDEFPDPDPPPNSILDQRFYRDISSYYVSVKDNILNQYGQICDINYLETSGCSFLLNNTYNECEASVFGGDTFINRFALKRKLPLFLRTNCNLPDGSDILYNELGNIGIPIYFFNTPETLLERIVGNSWSDFNIEDLLGALTSENAKNYDIESTNMFYQNGLISLFYYGIPYFLVESDINVDYRTGQNRTDKDFYPHNTDLKEWLEEGNVPISTDNYYFYNNTYSKQNHENTICTSCIINPRDLICDSTNYNRLIYSEPSNTENRNDNWLTFKANNYYDFDLTKGSLISADGIEDDKVLVRLEKATQIFNAYDTLQADSTNIQVGTGGIFATRPKDIAITDLGYAGTQHRDILHTEYGHIWADAQRGQVFKLGNGGNGMEELSIQGMKSWFKEHLPFEIKKYFPSIDIDNNLNGIGLHYGYDRRFNRFLITKLDYKPLVSNLMYTDGNFYEGDTKVELWNPKYFCNKSWTMSYNFFTNSWTSFHSYLPLFYVEHINTFDSSIKQLQVSNGNLTSIQKIYTHNATNKSYQVFYGKLEPFIIEATSKQDLLNNNLNSVEYYCEAIRYHNDFDPVYNSNKTYNKVIVYNERQTTGLLNLNISNPNDLSEIIRYPKITPNGLDILVSNSENTWKFNTFYNVVKNNSNNLPLFIYDCNHVNKQLNPLAISYTVSDLKKELIKGRMNKVRFIQDKESNYKFIHIFNQQNQRQSFR